MRRAGKDIGLPVLDWIGAYLENRRAVRIAKIVAFLIFLAVIISFPQVYSDPATTQIAVFTLLFAGAVTGWNIFSGYTGYIALGHAAYYGLGAYAIALMTQDWNISGGYLVFLFVPLAGLVTAVFSVPLGWIALRARRHTFIVITIATFFILQLMAYNLRNITNGSAGLSLPLIPLDWSGVFINIVFYYAALVILLLALATSWFIRSSKFGLGLLAIRDDEDRALGLGVKTEASKLIAFVISAFFVGMVGALHAYFIGSVFPPFAFDAFFDISIALMGFLGGLGTLFGPILGAFILEPAQQYFTLILSDSGFYLIAYGVLFLVVILLLPQGIVPTLRQLFLRLVASRSNVREIPAATIAAAEGQENVILAESTGRRDGVNS